MNRNYQGGDVGASDPPAGSVKRARERVQAGLPRESLPLRQLPTNPEPSRVDYPTSTSRLPQAVASGPARLTKSRPQQAGDGRAGRNISRPMHAPQWPLPGPAASPLSPGESEPVYTPSARAPRRPPRPSNVPSILDESEAREPAPPLTARSNPPESPDVASDGSYDVLSPAVASSRQTTSSIGTIPDFPVPAPAPAPASASGAAAKKSSTLGPPPSARRGASSFYSTASFVSPIPEESPRSRSHGSYASSAAMPEAWDRISPISGSPPYGDAFFDDSITDKESTYDEFGDESKLVRSASIGKKGKPALVMNRTGSGRKLGDARPAPSPVQPFNGGTGYVDASTSSSKSFPTAKPSPDTTPATTNQTALGPDATPVAIGIASSGFGDAADATDPSRPPNRLSNMRRPPRLDIDAVRAAEARGSLTSLPDLIRRATRLASMIDKGKRPGSRMDDLTFFGEKGPMRNGEGSLSADERHHSGLSDMLAAFPPPVHTPRGNRQSNASWFRPSSWPAVGDQGARGHSRMSSIGGNDGTKKQRRRCCGLPLWAFILVIFLLLCLVVAAIVVPLEFFVFKNLGNHGDDKDSLANCQSSLTCLNGGTNVVSQGVCSCICTNGFTGSNCGQSGSMGCTTTNLVATDGSASINNVTLGRAIPRLISQGDANFSLPLSGTIVLAKVNTANLSCIAQNALVTFDGWSTRGGEAKDEVTDASGKAARALANRDENFPPVSIITFVPRATSAVLTGGHVDTQPTPVPDSTSGPPVQIIVDTSSYGPPAGSKPTTASTTTEAGTGSSASGTGSPTPTPTGLFTVTEEVVDFGRVAMLYILQEESVNAAETAQTELQALFSRASKSKTQLGVQVTEQEARKVIVGGDNTINLVDFTVDVGKGPVGRKNIKRSVEPAAGALPPGPG